MLEFIQQLESLKLLAVLYFRSQISIYYPRFHNFSYFQQFLVLNIVLIICFILFRLIYNIRLRQLYAYLVRIFYQLPPIKKKLNKQLTKIREQIQQSFEKQNRSVLKKIPNHTPKIEIGMKCDHLSLNGHLSGSRYPIKAHSDFVITLARYFSYSNPLHVDLHPFAKQMENQCIQMVAQMLGYFDQKKQVTGQFTSGGTESILLAILAYRENGVMRKGIKKPNIVVCDTAHVAVDKGCDYFQIEIKRVKSDKDCKMSINGMKNQIDKNTICVYTSYPNYPYGTVDPVEEIAAICKLNDIPVHLDMCLGGFLVPFLRKKNGQKMLQIPKGITSISIDPHKYGLSSKGASILLYSDKKFLHDQLFVTTHWPGGLYGTCGFSGSRSSVGPVSSWISMMKIGTKGYSKNASLIQKATINLKNALKQLGFIIYGDPDICIVSFRHQTYSFSSIKRFMQARKWNLALNHQPMCFHYSLTPLNSHYIQDLINDFKECIIELEKFPSVQETSEVQIYGACANISDNSTKNVLINTILDAYLDI